MGMWLDITLDHWQPNIRNQASTELIQEEFPEKIGSSRIGVLDISVGSRLPVV